MRNILKNIFGFAKHQIKGTYGLGYKFALTKNSVNSVLNKANVTNKAKTKIDRFEWYVPHHTLSMEQQ